MSEATKCLNAYIEKYSINFGDSEYDVVLKLLYQSYADSKETDPKEIENEFREFEKFLDRLPFSKST